jgi:hypothetical protein
VFQTFAIEYDDGLTKPQENFSKLLWSLLHFRQAFIVAQYGFVREGLFACLVIKNLQVLLCHKKGANL